MKKKYSNCLIEAAKAKLKNPLVVRVSNLYKTKFRNMLDGNYPHFWWYNKKEKKGYHFVPYERTFNGFPLYYWGWVRRHSQTLKGTVVTNKPWGENYWHTVGTGEYVIAGKIMSDDL